MQYILFFAILFLPTYLIRFKIFGIPTTALEITIYAAFAVAFTVAWRRRELHDLFSLPREKLFRAGIVLLFSGVALSAALNPTLRAFGILKGWFFDPFLLFLSVQYAGCVYGFFTAHTPILHSMGVGRHRDAANGRNTSCGITSMLAYMISGFAAALIALAYAARGIFTYDGRLKAFYESPNHLAMYVAPAAIIALYFLLQARISAHRNKKSEIRIHRLRDKLVCSEKTNMHIRSAPHCQFPKYESIPKPECSKLKTFEVFRFDVLGFVSNFVLYASSFTVIIWCLVLGISAAILYFTRSQGAWLSVAVGFLAMILLPRLGARMRIAVIAALIAGSAFLPFVAVKTWLMLQQTFSISERSSAASRIMIWKSALAIGRENPVFGVGPGAFQERYLARQKNYPPYLEWAVPQPHNIFLAFWLQSGVLGLAGFLLLVIWFFRTSLPVLLACPERSREVTRYALLVPLGVYFLLHGAVDTLYWKNDLAAFFWILLATASLARDRAEPAHGELEKPISG